jgi:hypothetical protein
MLAYMFERLTCSIREMSNSRARLWGQMHVWKGKAFAWSAMGTDRIGYRRSGTRRQWKPSRTESVSEDDVAIGG